MGTRKNPRISRTRQRGAAMAEGIIVITTMLVFLGTTVYASKAYGGKIDQMTETRKDALFYASHHCDKKAPGSTSSTDPVGSSADGTGGNTSALDQTAGRLQNGSGSQIATQSGTSRDWNMSKSGLTGSASWSASVNTTPQGGINLQKVGLYTPLATESFVGCNEARYDNSWTALFEFGWDFLKTSGGVLGGP